MVAPAQKKLLALDTNLLFDLAAEKDFAHAFREVYQERGYSLVVPPTVCRNSWSLRAVGSVDRNRAKRRHAAKLNSCPDSN